MGREDEEEDVGSYRTALRKRKNGGVLRDEAPVRKFWRSCFPRRYGTVARLCGQRLQTDIDVE
jgi:hypothetical protein